MVNKYRFFLYFFVFSFSLNSDILGQINLNQGGIFSQTYSKEITEYKVKTFIVNEILQIPENKVIELEVDAITASKSGELTTVVYRCKELNKSGLILVFWSEYLNSFNLKYKGYAFKNLEFQQANTLLENLDNVLEEKKSIIAFDNNENLVKNGIYKFDDVTFIFYKGDLSANLIRVIWHDFDSEWNQSNLKTMKRRFNKFFSTKNK